MNLSMATETYETLTNYLDVGAERVAFLLFDSADEVGTVNEIVLLNDATDYIDRSRHGAELSEHVVPDVIRRAHAVSAGIAEVHMHGWRGPRTMFSSTDIRGLIDLGPHMAWRLRGRPYIALVLGPDSFDALVWSSGDAPQVLEELRIGGRATPPTGRSAAHFAAKAMR